MDQKQILLIKADGVEDCVKWINQNIKNKKKSQEDFIEMDSGNSIWCRDAFNEKLTEFTTEINTMVVMKASLEKYMKKLRHQADEISVDSKIKETTKLDRFLKGEIALHIPTLDLYDRLMIFCQKYGLLWASGEIPMEYRAFLKYKEFTCIIVRSGFLSGKLQLNYSGIKAKKCFMYEKLTEADFS